MSDWFNQFVSMVNGAKLITILVFFAVDFVLGVVVAIKNGTFALNKLASFLKTDVLYLIAGYYLLGIAAMAEPSWNAIVPTAFALIVATMSGDVLLKLKDLGLPIPEPVAKVLGKVTI